MKKKGKLVAAGLLLCVVAIGGTWAYFNQTLTVTNEFDTGAYDTELVEVFKPSEGENWEPGTEVNKDVLVQNTGSLPVVVRVKFEEKWTRMMENIETGEDVETTIYYTDTTLEPKVTSSYGDKTQDANNPFENVYQSDPDDGRTGYDVDDSVVYKVLYVGDNEDWVYNSADGYYYYKKVLKGYEDGMTDYDKTSLLLDSVTLSENVDMGVYQERKYYATIEGDTAPDKDSADWIEFATVSDATSATGYSYLSTKEMNDKLKKENPDSEGITFMKSITDQVENMLGYSDADYSLIITAQTVQATKLAVQSVFADDAGNELDYEGLGCEWDLTSEESSN